MEERSLRVYQQKTFFSKIGTTISKILIPTKIGVNGVIISVKRNNVLKAFEALRDFNSEDATKKENLNKKYEDVFALYLESIDKNIMDSIYKKVKSGTALPYEQEALSKYYMITNLKETEYLEYKYRKQKYLLELDYENLESSGKEKLIQRYNNFYIEKMDILYKGILKNYSIKLADNIKTSEIDKIEIYDKIFDIVEEYVEEILTLKMQSGEIKVKKEVIGEYDRYARFLVGKPDSIDILEKKMILLSLSRMLFTHSVPLVIVEQCYEQLLNEARSEIVYAKNDRKLIKAYDMLLRIMEEYNVNLLSTKIYWEKPKEKEEFKKFWDKYKEIDTLKEEKKKSQKEILFIKEDLKKIEKNEERYKDVISAHKKKLVELGAIKELKDKTKTKEGKLESKKTKNKAKQVKKEEKKSTQTVATETVAPKKRGRPRKNG